MTIDQIKAIESEFEKEFANSPINISPINIAIFSFIKSFLRAKLINLLETDVEWKKRDYRNTHPLITNMLCKECQERYKHTCEQCKKDLTFSDKKEPIKKNDDYSYAKMLERYPNIYPPTLL